MSSALDRQVGGDHYKGFAIQPVEFIQKNRLGFLEGCIVKRVCRYDRPTGKGLEDLEKVLHELDLLEEFWVANPGPGVKDIERYPISLTTFYDANSLGDNQKQAISAVFLYNRISFQPLARNVLNKARVAIEELKKTLPTP